MKAGLATRKAPSQPSEHQANVAAGQTVTSLRDAGRTLLQQVSVSFASRNNASVVPWRYIHELHAARVHKQLAGGATPRERAFHVKYTGRLAMCETLYFSLAEPHRSKGHPKFAKGISAIATVGPNHAQGVPDNCLYGLFKLPRLERSPQPAPAFGLAVGKNPRMCCQLMSVCGWDEGRRDVGTP